MSTLLAPEAVSISEEITALELKHWLDVGHDVQLIDVREPHEYAAGHLAEAKLIPLAQIAARASEIDSAQPAVVYCKGGVRSAKAILALKNAGYVGPLTNLKGGIVAWSKEVDSSVIRS